MSGERFTDLSRRLRGLAWSAAWMAVFAYASVRLNGALEERLARNDIEDDLYFVIPVAAEHSSDRGGALRFIFHMRDEYGVPSYNALHCLWTRWFGLELGRYSETLLWLHHVNALLFFLFLWRALHCARTTAALAALLFLAYYPQFHAYQWPLAAPHLLVMTGVFSVLILYHRAESHAWTGDGGVARRWRNATVVAAFLTSFLRPSVALAPLHILVHILLRSGTEKEADGRFRRWMPLFLSYVPFRAVSVATGGEGVRMKLPERVLEIMGPWAAAAALAALGCLAVLLMRILLRRAVRALPGILERFRTSLDVKRGALLASAATLLSMVFLAQWIVCFKLALFPLASILKSDLLFERGQAMGLPSLVQGGLTLTELSVLAAFLVFVGWSIRKSPERLVFLGWYLIAWLLAKRFEPKVPSRYFIYFAPVVAICLATLGVDVAGGLLGRFPRWKGPLCAAGAVVAAVLFVHRQTEAIRLRLHFTHSQGTLAIYAQARAAETIARDLGGRPDVLRAVREGRGRALQVEGVPPARLYMGSKPSIAPEWDDRRYHPFKFVLGAALAVPLDVIPSFRINEEAEESGAGYRMRDSLVYDASGRNLDPFYAPYLEGHAALSREDWPAAGDCFRRAAEARPFFLRHFFPAADLRTCFQPILKTPLELLEQAERWLSGGGRKDIALAKEEILDFSRALALAAHFSGLEGRVEEGKDSLRSLKGILRRRGFAPDAHVRSVLSGISDPSLREEIRILLEREIELAPPEPFEK